MPPDDVTMRCIFSFLNLSSYYFPYQKKIIKNNVKSALSALSDEAINNLHENSPVGPFLNSHHEGAQRCSSCQQQQLNKQSSRLIPILNAQRPCELRLMVNCTFVCISPGCTRNERLVRRFV